VSSRYPYSGEKFMKHRGKFKAYWELVNIHKERKHIKSNIKVRL